MMEKMTSTEKYELQKKYCISVRSPLFAPEYCYNCGKDVYERLSEKKCKSEVLTGCPHCHYSFVD